MITINRKIAKDVLEIVLDDCFGNETIVWNDRVVSKERSIRSSKHEFQAESGNYVVYLEASLMWGTITGAISRDGELIDQFSENPFKLSWLQKTAFLIAAVAFPYLWSSVWRLAGFPTGLPMLLSMIAPFAIVIVFVRLMIVRNMKRNGFWCSRVKTKESQQTSHVGRNN